MEIKNIRLARSENLSADIRREFGLPENGLVIIESRNPDLKEHFVAIKSGGIRDYLLSLADFKEAPLVN